MADALGITNHSDWRGFLISADGRFFAASHFNLPDGSLQMKAAYASQVEQELRQLGLVK